MPIFTSEHLIDDMMVTVSTPAYFTYCNNYWKRMIVNVLILCIFFFA